MEIKDLGPRLRPRVGVLTAPSDSVFMSSDVPLGRGRRTDADSLICSLGHCECDGHTEQKVSQRRLTSDLLAPRESDCSRMRSKVALTGCQVTSGPRDRFSRNSKWLVTFQTASYSYLFIKICVFGLLSYFTRCRSQNTSPRRLFLPKFDAADRPRGF
jgi:hypothetical protein